MGLLRPTTEHDALISLTLYRLIFRHLNNFIVQPLRINTKFQLSIVRHTRTTSTMSIQKIFARMIFDSRGNPTVEVDLTTEKGLFRAAVPSGASTGIHEALEMRDGVKAEFHGKGVNKAISNVNDIIVPALLKENIDVTDQTAVDNFLLKLDGTENKSKLGANAILGVSLAACKAGAAHKGVPLYRHIADLAGTPEIILPVPAFNVINILDNKDALNLISTAIEKAGYTGKIDIGMDVAASEFFRDGKYDLDFKNPTPDPSTFLEPIKLSALYQEFIKEFPMVSIEDPFDQDDWAAWTELTANTNIQIVGDDLTVTNPKRIAMGVERKSCNCLLLKVNQIGTVTESIASHNLAKASGWGTMVSHRSGETEDSFIADLVVGPSTGQIKTGAPCRSERLSKYNQILRIEEELGAAAKYAGKSFRHPL